MEQKPIIVKPGSMIDVPEPNCDFKISCYRVNGNHVEVGVADTGRGGKTILMPASFMAYVSPHNGKESMESARSRVIADAVDGCVVLIGQPGVTAEGSGVPTSMLKAPFDRLISAAEAGLCAASNVADLSKIALWGYAQSCQFTAAYQELISHQQKIQITDHVMTEPINIARINSVIDIIKRTKDEEPNGLHHFSANDRQDWFVAETQHIGNFEAGRKVAEAKGRLSQQLISGLGGFAMWRGFGRYLGIAVASDDLDNQSRSGASSARYNFNWFNESAMTDVSQVEDLATKIERWLSIMQLGGVVEYGAVRAESDGVREDLSLEAIHELGIVRQLAIQVFKNPAI